jgi:hypothetical protein
MLFSWKKIKVLKNYKHFSNGIEIGIFQGFSGFFAYAPYIQLSTDFKDVCIQQPNFAAQLYSK